MTISDISWFVISILLMIFSFHYIINGVKMIRAKKIVNVFPINLSISIAGHFYGKDKAADNARKFLSDSNSLSWGVVCLVTGLVYGYMSILGLILSFT